MGRSRPCCGRCNRGEDVLNGGGRDVHDGHGVVLLQSDVGLAFGGGNVLRFAVLGLAGGRADLAEDVHPLVREGPRERAETRRVRIVLCGRRDVFGQLDDAHGTLRVDGVVRGGLVLVGHESVLTVGGGGDHVRQ